MSARQYDLNGFFEVPQNPISRVGVFPYLGRSLGPEYEPDRVYNVFRSPEELGAAETLESFRLLPLVDDHTMLGDGETPAEEKGVHGTLGDRIWFDGESGTLYGNLKITSSSMSRLIDDTGKAELSCGYRCLYEPSRGTWQGQDYDVIQTTIRGNHIALVEQGRMGPDVRVLDHLRIAVDAKEAIPMTKNTIHLPKGMTTQDALDKVLGALGVTAVFDGDEEGKDSTVTGEEDNPDDEAADEEEDNPDDEAADEEGDKAADEEEDNPDDEAADEEGDKPKGLDMADVLRNVSRRDKLYSRLKGVTGVFDASEMTHEQVAAYGVRKLRLPGVPKGHEVTALDAYLAGRETVKATATATDSAAPAMGGLVGKYLSQGGV